MTPIIEFATGGTIIKFVASSRPYRDRHCMEIINRRNILCGQINNVHCYFGQHKWTMLFLSLRYLMHTVRFDMVVNYGILITLILQMSADHRR